MFLKNICSDAITGVSPWNIKEETQSTDTRTIARIKLKESKKLSLPHQKDDQTRIKISDCLLHQKKTTTGPYHAWSI